MSGSRRQVGKRKKQSALSEYIAWYKEYLREMTPQQRTRYLLLQGLVVLSIIIILVTLAVKAWVKLPELPGEGGNSFVSTIPTLDGSTGLLGNNEEEDLLYGDFSLEGAVFPAVSQSGRREGVYTFLVAGRDEVSNSMDTMILVTYDTVNKTIDAMSLLRDTMVNSSTSNKKLNHVYAYNRGSDKDTQEQKGMDALKIQVSRLTGIVPDFYVIVEWEAIGSLVDAVGGVWFDVPYDMKYSDPAQNLTINQAKGNRLLTGSDAMEVVRFRQNNSGWNIGDVGRVEIQQEFLMAVARTCLTPSILTKAPALAEIFLANVSTDLTLGNLLAFAQQAYGMDLENGIKMYSMPYYNLGYWNGGAYVGVSQNSMVELVNQGLNPYLKAITASDLQLVYSKNDGSFGVTTGTLADSRLSTPTSSSSSSSSSSTQTPEEDDILGQGTPAPEENTGTGDTGTGSTGSTGTGSTGSTGTGSTGSTGTGSTGSTGTGSTGSTGTGSTGSTGTGSTGSTGSTGTGSTGSTGTGSTGSTGTGSTGSTGTGSTGTGSTGDTGSGSTGDTGSGSTGSTGSGSTGDTGTGSTGDTGTGSTGDTGSGSTGSTGSGSTGDTGSGSTGSTGGDTSSNTGTGSTGGADVEDNTVPGLGAVG